MKDICQLGLRVSRHSAIGLALVMQILKIDNDGLVAAPGVNDA